MSINRWPLILLLAAGGVAGCTRSHQPPTADTGPSSETVAVSQEFVSGLTRAAERKPSEKTEPPPLAETIVIDLWGSRRYVRDLKLEDTKALVLLFMGTECPLVRLYVPTLIALENKFRDQDVQFVGVFSNASEDLLEMATFAHDYEICFPVVKDPFNHLADHLNVARVPEVVVLDRKLNVLYKGQINDQYRAGGRLPEANRHYLRDAIDEFLAGKPVSTPSTLASGCHLDRYQEPRYERSVTFNKDVVPIFQKKCQTCHRDGQIGPFPLVTYDEVRGHALMIAEVVEDRRMPPWLGMTDEKKFGKLANDLSLEEDQIDTILNWCRTGCVEGDPADMPPAVEWPSAWQIPDPDAIVEMDEPYSIPADGVLPYAYFQVPTGFQRDKWVTAVECRPGDPSVVHHMCIHITGRRKTRIFGKLGMFKLYGYGGERARVVGQYSFGDSYVPYPEGHAMRIPAGSYLTFEMHYTPSGLATQDQSRVAFKLADEPPQHRVRSVMFTKTDFKVPAHDPHVRIENSWIFRHTSRILAVKPHTHMRSKHYRFSLKYPDGRTASLLAVPRWDFDWQLEYRFADPPKVPKGTEIFATVLLDNSAHNPNNPDPTVDVKWGLQNWDEMVHARMSIVELPKEDEELPDEDESLASSGG